MFGRNVFVGIEKYGERCGVINDWRNLFLFVRENLWVYWCKGCIGETLTLEVGCGRGATMERGVCGVIDLSCAISL